MRRLSTSGLARCAPSKMWRVSGYISHHFIPAAAAFGCCECVRTSCRTLNSHAHYYLLVKLPQWRSAKFVTISTSTLIRLGYGLGVPIHVMLQKRQKKGVLGVPCYGAGLLHLSRLAIFKCSRIMIGLHF